ADTSVTASAAPSSVSYGDAVTLSYSGLPAEATGTVTFTSGGTTLCSVSVASGTNCAAPTDLGPGTCSVTATYSGDPDHAGSSDTTSFTVTKADTDMTAAATPSTATYGSP